MLLSQLGVRPLFPTLSYLSGGKEIHQGLTSGSLSLWKTRSFFSSFCSQSRRFQLAPSPGPNANSEGHGIATIVQHTVTVCSSASASALRCQSLSDVKVCEFSGPRRTALARHVAKSVNACGATVIDACRDSSARSESKHEDAARKPRAVNDKLSEAMRNTRRATHTRRMQL